MNKKFLKSQRKIKAVAWTNIFAQLAFPVAAAFTPAAAVAESERKVALTDSQLAELPVKPYVMKESDTLNSVASSYGLTVPQLRKLNQLRTFSSSFDNVKAGQEIDVPAVQIDDILPSATDKQAASSSFESDLASASTRTAGILQSSDISGSIAGQAKGLAVNQANQEINNWLNRAGTARAKLSVDNKGRLDGSELDMLIPLHDKPEALTFSQFGVRHIDDRTMANLGVGQRFYPAGEWMYGYNAFFDYDLRRDHSRLGFGLEMARDYLKLGANSYFRTSNWRGSPDVIDFDERPANGFDLRTEAYIPALPQLGGSLAYEQYYGEDVGLFGKNNRSRNPAAFTAGLNYTPFPLLTLGVERKQGTTSGDGETRFNIGLTYDINGSWAQQIDPDAVNAKRTLAGTRYDLVERNNEIVLEYRKKEVIRLKVDSLVTGESGETKAINYSVNAKYGLGSIRWDDAALVAAGGSIKQEGDKFSVILPPYTEGGVNSWVISSVAIDKKGNSSKRAETQVSVTSATISITESLFDSQEDVIPADSQSTSVITLKLEDGAGNPVTGLASEITLEALMPGTSGTLPSFSAFREVSPGVYEAVMTAGSGFGKLTVTPSVRGVVLAPIVIDVVAPVAPVAEALKLTGSLAVGSTLSGSYTYTQPQQTESSSRNIAALTDQSYYAWGEKGTTASAVSNGKTVSESGQIPGYTIQPSDVSKILELSLLPRNSGKVSGKIITVDTSMSKEQGNESDGGSNGGQIIDVTAA
ncbi:TPA: inverse autotransporter beta domain-containing protein, partial [Enterobacter asburiae]